MAAPLWEGVGTTFASVNAVEAPLPAGVAENDILLLFVESADAAGAAPTGYAHVTTVSPQHASGGGLATQTCLAIYWKRATSSEANPTVADTGNHQFGFIARISGCVTTGDPWNAANGDADTTADTAVDIPGATTTAADCLVIAAVAVTTDTTTPQFTDTPPILTNANLSSLTTRFNEATTEGNGGGIGVVSGVKATAGDYGTTTGTALTSSKQGRISLALEPVAGGPSPITGTAAVTLGSFTPAASGTYTPAAITGTSAQTLDTFTPAASGAYTPPAITGTSATTLEAFTSDASGTSGAAGVTGSAAVSLSTFDPAASGTYVPPAIFGTVAVTLDDFTSTASGTHTNPALTGTAAVTLDAFTPAASGTVVNPITGTSATTLGDFSTSTTGLFQTNITGTSATTLDAFEPAGTGTFTGAITGTSATTLDEFTGTADGTYTPGAITGIVDVTLGGFTMTGSGLFIPFTELFFDLAGGGAVSGISSSGGLANTVEGR